MARVNKSQEASKRKQKHKRNDRKKQKRQKQSLAILIQQFDFRRTQKLLTYLAATLFSIERTPKAPSTVYRDSPIFSVHNSIPSH